MTYLSDGPDPKCTYCKGTGIIHEYGKPTGRPCLCDLDPPDDGVTTRQKYRKPRRVSVFGIPYPSPEAKPHG